MTVTRCTAVWPLRRGCRKRGDVVTRLKGVLVVSVYDLSRAEHLNPHMNMPGKNQDSSLYKGKRWIMMDDLQYWP
jgi:hypothetical protein